MEGTKFSLFTENIMRYVDNQRNPQTNHQNERTAIRCRNNKENQLHFCGLKSTKNDNHKNNKNNKTPRNTFSKRQANDEKKT